MKKNVLKMVSVFSLASFLPLIAFAAPTTTVGGGCTTTTGLCGIVYSIGQLFGYVIPVLIALGIVYFVWGVVQYVIADGEEAKKKGRDRMIFGIIGLAVIIAVWALVNVLLDTFGIQKTSAPTNTELQNLLPGSSSVTP